MSRFVQPLESRTFMSVSANTLSIDLANVRAAATELRAVGVELRSTVVADRITIAAAVRADSIKANRAANNRLIATLVNNDVRLHARVVATADLLVTIGNLWSELGAISGKALVAHPTSIGLQRAVTNDVHHLNTDVPNRLANLTTALNNKSQQLDTDLNNLATADPTRASLISNDEATIGTKVATYQNKANAYEGATAALATDLSSI